MFGKEITAFRCIGVAKPIHATIDIHTCKGCDRMWTQFNFGTPLWKRVLGWTIEKIMFLVILAAVGYHFGLWVYGQRLISLM